MSKFTPRVLRRVLDDIKSQSLTPEELAFMVQEFERVAALAVPEADYTISPIRQKQNIWHRQKPLKDNAVYPVRNIVRVDRDAGIIELIAILRRTDDTYEQVTRLWGDPG